MQVVSRYALCFAPLGAPRHRSHVCDCSCCRLLVTSIRPAQAMKIQTVKSPGGIEAWLVEEHSVPLMALRFAFEGGSSQDPVGKEGLANFITAMLDEGAGDLTSEKFQERMEDLSMRMSFEDGKDAFYGSFETLIESIATARSTCCSSRSTSLASRPTPSIASVASCWLASSTPRATPTKSLPDEWYATAFAGHPYGSSRQRHARVPRSDHPRRSGELSPPHLRQGHPEGRRGRRHRRCQARAHARQGVRRSCRQGRTLIPVANDEAGGPGHAACR